MTAPGCGLDCPCIHPRVFLGGWMVFSTGQTFVMVEVEGPPPKAPGRDRNARFFQWVAA